MNLKPRIRIFKNWIRPFSENRIRCYHFENRNSAFDYDIVPVLVMVSPGPPGVERGGQTGGRSRVSWRSTAQRRSLKRNEKISTVSVSILFSRNNRKGISGILIMPVKNIHPRFTRKDLFLVLFFTIILLFPPRIVSRPLDHIV